MSVVERTSAVRPPLLGSVEAAIGGLLDSHPAAAVGAFDANGNSAPLPEFLEPRRQLTEASQALVEELLPEDLPTAVRLWAEARMYGHASGWIRKARQPGTLRLSFFDLRHLDEKMLVVLVDDPCAGSCCELPEVRPPQPAARRLFHMSKTVGAVVTWVDREVTTLLGWRPDELVGMRMLELVHPDDHELAIANWVKVLERPGWSRSIRVRHRHRDGSYVWLSVANQNRLFDERFGDIFAELAEVAEESVPPSERARDQLFSQLTETVPIGLFHADVSGQLLFANRRLREIAGTPEAKTLSEQLSLVTAGDREKLEEALQSAVGGADVHCELTMRSQAGGLRYCALRLRPLLDDTDSVTGLTGCLEEVTESVLSRRRLELKAASDPLTGCLNRDATLETLEALLAGSSAVPNEAASGTAVIFVDLDRFKPVNDEFGHAEGDKLLATVGSRIRSAVRSGDTVGRFGGDEFVVLCPDVEGAEQALDIARALAERAFGTDGLEHSPALRVQASMGVAFAARGDVDATGLIRAADEAMYAAKRAGAGEPKLAASLA